MYRRCEEFAIEWDGIQDFWRFRQLRGWRGMYYVKRVYELTFIEKPRIIRFCAFLIDIGECLYVVEKCLDCHKNTQIF